MDSSLQENTSENNKDNLLLKCDNISDLVTLAFERYSARPFLGYKIENQYKWLTYGEVFKIIRNVSNFFSDRINTLDFFTLYNFNKTENKLIGIFSKSCMDAFITIIALHSIKDNITVLPIFDNITESELIFILKQTELKTLIIDIDCFKLLILNKNSILQSCLIKNLIISGKQNDLKEIEMIFGEYEEYLRNIYDIQLVSFTVLKQYENFDLTLRDYNLTINNGRIIMLNYTSGIKGESKGVLISERSLLSCLVDLQNIKNISIDSEDSYFSLTCLADIPEYLYNLLVMSNGGSIGFYSGDQTKFFDDIQALKPTIMYSFPRTFIKIFEALNLTINRLDEAKKSMIEKAIKVKIEYFQNENSLQHHIWDKLVFNKIKHSMGGKIRLILVGGGHLTDHILKFLKICLSANIIEIYGVTECCGIITLSNGKELDNRYIGDTLESVEVKLQHCNKIGYYSPYVNSIEGTAMTYGELCVKKGNNFFSGYFKNLTAEEVVDNEGWFQTGDYMIMIENFKDNSLNLRFIDRVDNFITTKQRFLISPCQLEQYYICSDYISHISIFQDDNMNLVAIVALNKNKTKKELGKYKQIMKGNFSSTLKYKSGDRKTCVKRNSDNINDRITSESENNSTSDKSEIYHIDCPINSNMQEVYTESLIINPNKNESLKEEIMNSFKIIWSNYKLKAYEMINIIHILDNIIPSVENGLLTSKLKIKKEVLKSMYYSYIENEIK